MILDIFFSQWLIFLQDEWSDGRKSSLSAFSPMRCATASVSESSPRKKEQYKWNYLPAMASNLEAMASNLIPMASNLLAMASNLIPTY